MFGLYLGLGRFTYSFTLRLQLLGHFGRNNGLWLIFFLHLL
jgi:hypothetical protein